MLKLIFFVIFLTLFYNLFHFFQAQYFKDLPSSILTGAKDRLVQLTEGSVMLADYLVNSPAMQWLVSISFW